MKVLDAIKEGLRSCTVAHYVAAAVVSLLVCCGYIFNAGLFENVGMPYKRLALIFVGSFVLTMAVFVAFHLLVTHDFRFSLKRLKLLDDHPILLSWAIIFLCWVPWIIMLSPGVIAPNDTLDELQQFMGVRSFTTYMSAPSDPDVILSNHHPLLYTYILGWFTLFGQTLFGNASIGLFLLSIAQSLALSASFACIVSEIKFVVRGQGFLWLAIVFFALTPTFPILAVCFTKDIFLTAVFIMMLVEMVRVYRAKPETFKALLKVAWRLFLFTILVCLLRKNALVAVLVLVFLGLFSAYRFLKMVVYTLAASLISALLVLQVVLPVAGIPGGSFAEMMAIPMSQVARTVALYPDSLTPEDVEAIDEVLNYDTLHLRYNPWAVDPVKNERNMEATTGQWLTFLQTWAKLGLQHPETYFDASLNLLASYFCPNVDQDVVWFISFGWIDGATGEIYDQSPDFEALGLTVDSYGLSDEDRIKLGETYDNLNGTVLGLCVNMGFAFCVALLCFATFVSRKDRLHLFVSAAVLLYALTLIASASIGLIRYDLPVIAAMPLLVAFACYAERHHAVAENDSETPALHAKASR